MHCLRRKNKKVKLDKGSNRWQDTNVLLYWLRRAIQVKKRDGGGTIRKKLYILALIVLLTGIAVAHTNDGSAINDEEVSEHYLHMLAHHGSLGQWSQEHGGQDWFEHHGFEEKVEGRMEEEEGEYTLMGRYMGC